MPPTLTRRDALTLELEARAVFVAEMRRDLAAFARLWTIVHGTASDAQRALTV